MKNNALGHLPIFVEVTLESDLTAIKLTKANNKAKQSTIITSFNSLSLNAKVMLVNTGMPDIFQFT